MGVKLSEWRLKVTDLATGTMGKISGAADKTAGKFTGLQDKINKFSGGVKGAASEVPGLNRAIELVSNPYVALAAGVAALGTAAVVATNKAMDFEKGMAKINTTARLARPELDALRSRLLTMGADSTVTLSEIPDAYNQIISAVGDADKAMQIFQPALKAAQAGFSDMKTVSDAAANVLGATSMEASKATEVYDTLFAAVRQGKGEFSDFASYLPKILPLSQNLGLSYQEVAGSFALLTSKGQSAEYATTLLSNAFTALSKSEVIHGTTSKLGFERSGIMIHDNMGRMRKLADIVADLGNKTKGMTDSQRQAFLSNLNLDAQASSLFSILAQNAEENKQFVDATTNSAGELAAAYERSLSPADNLKRLTNQYDLLMTNIGYKLLPYVNRGLELGLEFVQKIKANSEPIADFFGAAVAPVRLLWSATKGVYNVLTSISELSGGSMGSMMEQLFGGSGNLWAEIKDFLTKFYATINATLEAIDIASEGNIKGAFQRFTDLQAKMNAADSMKAYDSKKADGFLKTMGVNFLDSPAAQSPYAFGKGPKSVKEYFDKNKPPQGLRPIDDKTKDKIKAVNDGGRQIRNVTVNIGALVKELKVVATTATEAAKVTEEFIIETILKAINGAEEAASF